MNTPSLPKRLRSTLLVALILAIGSCKGTGDALLIVSVRSDRSLMDVQRFDVTIAAVTEGGPVKTYKTLKYSMSDGGGVNISTAPLPVLGVTLSGDSGDVTVKVQAYGADPSPLASGTSKPLKPTAGVQTRVDVLLGQVPNTDGGTPDGSQDGGDSGDSSGEAGDGGVGAPSCSDEGGAGDLDRNGAQWPMPNNPKDVDAGAPHLASYTKNDDGTVTDTVTGLMWQRVVEPLRPGFDGGIFSQDAGAAYCQDYIYASHSDWRLPSLIELVSIVDDAVDSPPSIDSKFGATTSISTWPFWSSTPQAGPTSAWWSVDFVNGFQKVSDSSNTLFVRCVRAGPTTSGRRYAPDGQTVSDCKTGLVWQKTSSLATSKRADAVVHCQNLGETLGGKGWRLPTKNELLTIVDVSQSNPSIDSMAFPNTPAGDVWFWSATFFSNSSVPWKVNFRSGAPDVNTGVANVRCVR